MRARGELIRATKPFAHDDWRLSWWHLGSTLAVLVALLGITCLDMSWLLRLPFSLAASLVMVRLFVLYHDYQHGAILRRSWLADIIFTIYGLLIATPPSTNSAPPIRAGVSDSPNIPTERATPTSTWTLKKAAKRPTSSCDTA